MLAAMKMVTPPTAPPALVFMLDDGRKVPEFLSSERGDFQAAHGPRTCPGYLGGHGKQGDWES